MKCKICGIIDSDFDGSLCNDCSTAINVLHVFIEDLEEYLATADARRLPDFYSTNLPYFVTTLSAYNRYVSVKNLIQEIVLMYVTEEVDGSIQANDLENSGPLKSKKIRELLSRKNLIFSAYDPSRTDYIITPQDKLKISRFVFDSFGLEGAGFLDYLNSIFLYSMLILIIDDITLWIGNEEKLFPRRGFYPIRLISGAIRRALSESTQNHYVRANEIFYAIKGLTNKGKTRAISQIIGMDFQSKSIFTEIPDSDETSKTDFTEEFSGLINHFAERIRERMSERENIR